MIRNLRIAMTVVFLLLLAGTSSAQFSEMKIARGERFLAGSVTLARAAETPLGHLSAGTYEVEVEYRYLRRVIVTFLQGGRPIAEGYGYLKGFPEAIHRENSAVPPFSANMTWKELGFGAEGSIEIRAVENRDVLTVHPAGSFSERGSIILRLEPDRAATATARVAPSIRPGWSGVPDRPQDPMDDSL